MRTPPLAQITRLAPLWALVLALVAAPRPTLAQDEGTRLLRTPDISQDKIVFVYAGDLWLVESSGGVARRLTSHEGLELYPKFSPDGRSIAFSAEYSGTRQIHVISVDGGTPRQLTWYNDIGEMPPRGGVDNIVQGWTPDGKKIIYRANRIGQDERLGRPFTVPAAGGLEEPMRIPESGSADISPDGTKMAFTPIAREFRTWKRHRGGRTPDVWIYDFKADSSERIAASPAIDFHPVWLGDTIYFLSDRERVQNLWAYDVASKAVRKVTKHDDWDALWPSGGPGGIVYEAGGWIWRYDPATDKSNKVTIRVQGDFPLTVPHLANVAENIEGGVPSPSGKRALLVARGDLWTIPAEKGEPRNLTRTPAIRERDATWSPDGKWVSYLSDRTGEYEIYVRPADGSGEERRVTTDGGIWRFTPVWSPDSKRLLFGDKKLRLRAVDVADGKIRDLDKSTENDLNQYAWSPDSRFVAYTKVVRNLQATIWIYSFDEGKARQLTSEGSSAFGPAWDPKGRYLYFTANRDFNLTGSGFEQAFLYTDPTRVYVGLLAKDSPALFTEKSDEEETESSDDKAKGPTAGVKVKIDFEGFEGRVRALPGASGDYRVVSANENAVFWVKGDGNDGPPSVYRFDLESQETKKVLAGVGNYELSANGKKILFRKGNGWGLVDASPDQNADARLDLSGMLQRVIPRDEWRQLYDDSWRLIRDYFYDEKMHNLDWKAIGAKYRQLVPFVADRNDLDFILGELLAETEAGHAYHERAPGSLRVTRLEGGLLGAVIQPDPSGYVKIAKIYRGENWHDDFRSPLTDPSVKAAEGELILAVDGVSTKDVDNFYRLLEGKGGRMVTLTLHSKPTTDGARTERVRTITSEHNLRYLDWVAANRAKVEKLSGGRIGYIHLPNTAIEGHRELFRHFYAQTDKEALIFDDRYNGGGFIPTDMVGLIARPLLNYWVRRGQTPYASPDFVHAGPKVCLINWDAGSGGDAFPYYFKKMGLGPLIGTRTWGGLIGLSGNPPLMDGGSVLVPQFRFMDTDGKYIIENEGVSPDIEVVDTPHLVAQGQDPTLERGIQYLLEELKKNPRKPVATPQPPPRNP